MSLKAFHIIFVTCSVLLCFGFGTWCVAQFMDDRGALYLIAAVGGYAAGAGLIRYGIVILRKLKNESWM
jgi:hypothetical protein